jgi:protein SCO1/2
MDDPSRSTLTALPRRQRSRSAIVVVAAAAVLAAACTRDAAPSGVVRSDPLDVAQVSAPDVTDPSQRGRGDVVDGRLRMVAGEGRLLLVSFGFLNCPDVCPTTLMDLKVALGQLDGAERDRVDVVFVTVDPERDTAEAMAAYLHHFYPTYHAVRPEGAELETMLAAFLASAEVRRDADGAVSDVSHTALLYAVDDRGRVVIEWPFGTSSNALSADLRKLLAAMANSRA